MKNTISYFYNIVTNDLHHSNDKYYFSIDKDNYLLLPFYGDIKKKISIYKYIRSLNIYCLEIINNKNNELITIINDKPYVLLKDNGLNRKIIYYDLLNFVIPVNNEQIYNWKNLWIRKIDYYKYQIEQNKQKYPLLYQSFFYYEGLTELAISLMNQINLKNVKSYINHYRINKRTTLRDFYNPINLVIDTRVRDIAEYYKMKYFYDEISISDIRKYLLNSELNYEESLLFLIRMIYPSYYFDIYDDIIIGKEKENRINQIINKINNYEELLKDIYYIICNMYQMPQIEWLKKVVKLY